MSRAATRCPFCNTLFEEEEGCCPGCRRAIPSDKRHIVLTILACVVFLAVAAALAYVAFSYSSMGSGTIREVRKVTD